MDERVLKWVTFLCGVLTVVVCVSLYFFPDLHAREVLAAEQQERVGGADVVADYVDPDEVVVSDETVDAQLAIALPQDLPEDELEVENDYITQTVYIRFAGGVDDYFEQYGIKGSSDHIASLSYYKDGDEGVIALMLDRVYELSQEYRSGSLYLDFVDPHDIYDKIVVVDAGHGGKMPGALKLGIAEKDIDLAILLKLKAMFDADDENIGVYYTRTTDANPTLDQRCSSLTNAMRICLSASTIIRRRPVILRVRRAHRSCTANQMIRSCPVSIWRRSVWIRCVSRSEARSATFCRETASISSGRVRCQWLWWKSDL